MTPMLTRAPITNALTIDVEDYCQVSAFAPHIDRADWDNRECRVEHNIDRMASLLSQAHPQVPEASIRDVLRKHLTVDDQRQDLFKLYSEKNFSDAEFASIVEAMQDPAKARAMEDTEAGKRLSEKLTALMRETARDAKVQALVEQRMQDVENELDALAKEKSGS